MKKVFQAICEFMESMRRATSAAHLTRMGLHKEAKKLLLAD